jgi:uncharacterized protein (DUF433 family)
VITVAAERIDYQDRIVQDPNVLVGKPIVKGTRIPVELVLAKLAANPDLNELFSDYPRLTVDDVRACLDHARVLVQKKTRPRRELPPDARPQS